MKNTQLFFIAWIVLSWFACNKEATPIQPTDECVTTEQITSTDSSFYIYYPGLEENGYATGIKLNKEWRASALTSTFKNQYFFYSSLFFLKTNPTGKLNPCNLISII